MSTNVWFDKGPFAKVIPIIDLRRIFLTDLTGLSKEKMKISLISEEDIRFSRWIDLNASKSFVSKSFAS